MAPSKTKLSVSANTAAGGPSEERQHIKSKSYPYAKKPRRSNDDDALPGVQKLKSALRQTKRLLVKGNLAADIRVETERRLKSLESDLTRAEQSQKERHFATKYHKVKFFERKKIVRKINQTKRSIEASNSNKEKKKLESTLADLRVDLNYVLHFPKTKKYVSLFPPEVRNSGSTTTPVLASSDGNEERSNVREMIRQQMKRGELSDEPEIELGKLSKEARPLLRSSRRVANKVLSTESRMADGVTGDDFFGDDDDEGSQQSKASDS